MLIVYVIYLKGFEISNKYFTAFWLKTQKPVYLAELFIAKKMAKLRSCAHFFL